MGKGLEKFKAQAEKEINDGNEQSKAYRQQTYGAMLKHIEEVCDEEYDALLAQEHKTFERMFQFVKDKARAAAVSGCAMIDDPTVYGWCDEYMGTDDKAECEKKLEAERKREEAAKNTQSKTAKKPKKSNQAELDFSKCDSEDAEDEDADTEDEDDENDEPKPSKPTSTKAKTAPKEDKQLDFFSMM